MKITRSIPVYIHPAFWLLASFIAWMSSQNLLEFGLWVIIVFVSVLVHELGHALTATFWKQKVHIQLIPLGGVTVRHGRAIGKFKEFIIVLMGPIAGFLLAVVGSLLLLVVPPKPVLVYFLQVLVNVNVFWSILNLLPVQPLDGGKLITIVLEALFGLSGVRYSYLLSALFAIACTLLFVSLGALIGVVLFLLFAYESFRMFLQDRHVRVSGEDDAVLNQIKLAEKLWQQNDPDRALEQLEGIIKNEPKGQVYYLALETLVGFLLALNQNQKAYSLLQSHKSSLTQTLSKQMQLASFKLRLWDESLEYGKKVFSEEPDISSAILSAFASAHVERAEDAVNWLKAVKRINCDALPSILQSQELDAIRSSSVFQDFAAK